MGDVDMVSLQLPAVSDHGSVRPLPPDSAAARPMSDHRSTRDSRASPSLSSTRRRSRSCSPIATNSALSDGSARNRPSPGPQSLHSSRRSPSPVSIRPQEPVGNGSTRSRTSPTRQSLHSSRRRSPSAGSPRPDGPTSGAARSIDSSELDNEEIGLFDFAEELRREKPPGEPWFMEMTRLRRLHFLWLNKELAAIRKKILQDKRASREDMRALQGLLRDQASAIRDFQYIRSLDFLSSGQMEQRRARSTFHFPKTAHSADADVDPFETENYRCLPRAQKTALEPFSDEVREFFRTYMPSQITWTKAEMEAKPDLYHAGYAPTTLSPTVDRLARFTIAMAGALFILVPMYIMAIDQSRTKNLVTTTVAVVLFALLCSVTLRTSNDQTLAATAGYAAVLMVFVGLTSTNDREQ